VASDEVLTAPTCLGDLAGLDAEYVHGARVRELIVIVRPPVQAKALAADLADDEQANRLAESRRLEQREVVLGGSR
jgi:hypothetical protein